MNRELGSGPRVVVHPMCAWITSWAWSGSMSDQYTSVRLQVESTIALRPLGVQRREQLFWLRGHGERVARAGFRLLKEKLNA